MKPVTLGILSTANINRHVIPPAHASEKVELVAVASRDQARADEYAAKWEIPRAYGSYESLLEDEEIEAVYISLPNNLHVEWSIRAVEAGKHVLCEKPMGKRAAEVEAALHARMPVIELRCGGETERIELELVDPYPLELENVCDAIRGEGELLLGREDAVGNARAIEALAASAEQNEPVSL